MYDDLFINNGLTLNALRSFLLVADNGGYSAAAGGDESKTANLKNRVAGLSEPFHGVPLFQRQGRSIVPTSKGRELQSIARQVLQMLTDFQSGCLDERQLVRIGGGQSFFDQLFVPHWPAIHRECGKSRFQFHNLRTAETISQLAEQKIDFGLVRRGPAIDGLASAQLGTVKFALFVPVGIQKPGTSRTGIASLPKKLPMATISGGGEFRGKLDAFGKRIRRQFQYVMECTSQAQVRTFLETGTVAAVLPDDPELIRPDIIRIPIDEADGFSREAMLVWLPARLSALPELDAARELLMRRLSRNIPQIKVKR